MPAPQHDDRDGPSVQGAYADGWEAMKAHFLILLGLTVLFMVVQGVGNSFTVDVTPANPVPSSQDMVVTGLGSAWSALVVGPFSVGMAYVFLKAARGQEPEAGDVGEGFRHYLDSVVAMLLMGIAIVIGLILLIVPGIIIGIRLSFTAYILADEKLSAIEALKASWARTEGHSWQILGFGLLAILILLGGLLLLLVGIIPATMWVGTSYASFYHRATGGDRTPVPPEATGRHGQVPAGP